MRGPPEAYYNPPPPEIAQGAYQPPPNRYCLSLYFNLCKHVSCCKNQDSFVKIIMRICLFVLRIYHFPNIVWNKLILQLYFLYCQKRFLNSNIRQNFGHILTSSLVGFTKSTNSVKTILSGFFLCNLHFNTAKQNNNSRGRMRSLLNT